MKKIIVVILVLMSGMVKAQTPTPTGYLVQSAKWKYVYKIWADSGIYIDGLQKYPNQLQVLCVDSVTKKIGYKYITTSSTIDTTSLSNRINLRVKYTDTSAMLAPYFLASDSIQWRNRLRYSDTAGMLLKYLRAADTLKLSNRINLKQDIITAGNGIIKGGSTLYADTTKLASLRGNSWQNGMYLGSSNNRSMIFRTNNLQRMRLDSNGRVLIGVTPSIYKLRVQSTDELGVHISTVGGNAANPPFYFTSTTQSSDLEFYLDNTNANIGPYANKGIQFVKNAGGDKTVLINNSGNLLVGTITDVPSAKLVVSSTTQGFLPPLMTTTQRTSISSPAEGLMVYDLTLHKLYVWDGSAWQAAW